jgi:YMGG-like Gly-zipper
MNIRLITITLALAMAGCVSVPNGPSKMALPGSGKTFQQFSLDDQNCRQYALNQIGGKTAAQQSNDSFVQSAALGTAIGAVVGAAAGGHHGVGVGAATGLATGSMVGASSARASAYTVQQRYDNAYLQCMYATGHKIPVQGGMMQNHGGPVQTMPYPSENIPPPPPPGYGQ